jgi:hypothetical protein
MGLVFPFVPVDAWLGALDCKSFRALPDYAGKRKPLLHPSLA